MTEATMQTMFRKYLESNPPFLPEVYELKLCKGTSLPFEAVKPHQVIALKQATTGLFHKLTEPPIFYNNTTRFNLPRPFDCMYLKGIKGYVIVWFYVPRTKKTFIKIPIAHWLAEQATCGRKSITEAMALNIGTPLDITT